MTAPESWFTVEPDEATGPRLVADPPGRVQVPAPVSPRARGRVTGWASPPEARSDLIQPVIVERTGRITRSGPVLDPMGGGSVLFDGRGGHAVEPPPLPPPGLSEGSGGAPPPRFGEDEAVTLSRRLASLLQPSVDLLLAAAGPMEWPRPLLAYQLVGIRELVERPSLLLADDMGLGKGIQSVAALRILLRRREIESALVVVPAGLVSQWRGEVRRWAPELRVATVHGPAADRGWLWRSPAHLYLTSYETLRADYTDNPHAPVARLWDLVVLDEAQRIKNADTEVSRVCKRLRRRRQWALSGTPLENSPDDLISLLEFVDPGESGPLRHAMWSIGLRDHLRRVQLRRRKRDVLLDLPPKRVSRVVLPLAPRQRVSYDAALRKGVRELEDLGDERRPEHVFNVLGRLRQICNVCPASGESSKLTDLQDRLVALADEGHKALIFSQFANAAYGARAIATRLGPAALAYTGDMDQATRDRVLNEFRSNPDRTALVLSLLAGGQGLNLQEASYVFHFDRWWNPAVVGQAEARSHRLGQRDPVNVYIYTSENTIEERLDRILREKQLLFDDLVDDVSIDVPASLADADLWSLLGLAPPTSKSRAVPARGDIDGLDDAALATLARRELERQGWRVEPERRVAGWIVLPARRGDGGALTASCRVSAAPLDVEEVRGALSWTRAGHDGAKALLVCPGGLTAEARAYAADRDAVVWDRERLREVAAGDA